MGRNDSLSTEKRELQRSYESVDEDNKRLQAKLQSLSQNFTENMKKKDLDLQKSLEAKLEYETRIEHLQKQLKDQSQTIKSIKGDLEAEKRQGQALGLEVEGLRSKNNGLEENNRRLQGINEEMEQREIGFKGKLETLGVEIMEREYQEKLRKIEEVFI